jgi:hypothetical protein
VLVCHSGCALAKCVVLPSIVVGRMHCLCCPSWLSALDAHGVLFELVTATLLPARCACFSAPARICMCVHAPAITATFV